MSKLDFEYAIRKDVRNNPIVREVDRDRLREMCWWAFIGVLFVGVLLFSGMQHFELIRYGYRLEQMQDQRAAEERARRHLTLEVQALLAPRRLERIATGPLRLVSPTPERSVIVERVVTTPPPGQALVASR